MRRTGDQYLVKEINLSIVLDTILRRQPISRANISTMTGLNKGTVSSLVQELIERKLVFETGTGSSSGGRKPVLLQFADHAGFAIGVDLGVNYIHAVLTNLTGKIEQEFTINHYNESEQSVLQHLKDGIQTLIDAAPPSAYGIIGIGLGIPGIVNSSGEILFAPNLGWHNMDLASLLRDHFQIPVYVDNEANAGAIGELQYGAGQGTANLVFISAGIGIGSGIILHNEIYKGNTGLSGEIGHLTIEATGKPCRCGNRGCWELYASEQALVSLVSESNPKENLSLEDIVQLAKQENAMILQSLTQVGRYLGIGIAGILNIFNPRKVIIGNRLTKVSEWLLPPLLKEVRTRSLPHHLESVEIQFSNPGFQSTAMGSAHMAISSFLKESTVTPKNGIV